MQSNLTLIPKITIHPDRICLFKEVNWHPTKPSSKIIDPSVSDENEINQNFIKSTRKNNGYLSTHAKRKLYRAIDYLLITSKKKKVYSKLQKKYITFKIVFVTLTLPSEQCHSDKEITNLCLNQFFIELQRYHHIKKYIWRAEKQNNGDIHYHILINEFIEYQELRKRWNRIVNKLGYVDRYRVKMKNYFKNGFKLSDNPNDKRTIEQQRRAFIIGQKSDWTSPNSTDIHDTRKIYDIKKYIGKYLTKNPDLTLNSTQIEIDKLQVRSRLWSCSQNLSNISGCQLYEDWEISDELEKLATNSKCKIYRDCYFSVLFINIQDFCRFGSTVLYNYFSAYLLQQFDFSLQSSSD